MWDNVDELVVKEPFLCSDVAIMTRKFVDDDVTQWQRERQKRIQSSNVTSLIKPNDIRRSKQRRTLPNSGRAEISGENIRESEAVRVYAEEIEDERFTLGHSPTPGSPFVKSVFRVKEQFEPGVCKPDELENRRLVFRFETEDYSFADTNVEEKEVAFMKKNMLYLRSENSSSRDVTPSPVSAGSSSEEYGVTDRQPNGSREIFSRRVSSDEDSLQTDGRTAQVHDISPRIIRPSMLLDYVTDLGKLEDLLDDLPDFINEPCPKGVTVRCRVTRDRKGVDRGLYPTYYLRLERANSKNIILLSGRKRKRSKTSNYLISLDPTDLSRNTSSFVGKVRSNVLGTAFTVYDHGENPSKCKNLEQCRSEIAAVLYDTNILGFKGPRKMKVLLPKLTSGGRRSVHRSITEEGSLLQQHNSKTCQSNEIVLKNRSPVWNHETESFVLNFFGRVNQASVKNFQLISEEDEDYDTEVSPQDNVMQFGRVEQDVFSLDYSFPLCALQAFAIALTSFDSKLACE